MPQPIAPILKVPGGAFYLEARNRNIYISGATLILHMIQNYSRYKILEVFFREPRKIFLIREISRRIRRSQPSIRLHLDHLVKDGLIVRSEGEIYAGFKANRENEIYKLLKQQNTVLTLHQSGCIKLLSDTLMPQAIVLFGSAAKGEDIDGSDIDLFIEGEEEELDLSRFEKIINRKISLLFEREFRPLSKELKNNIVNGIKLQGFLRAF